MRGIRSFLIKAKPVLVELLNDADDFYRYLEKDVILTAELSDRHGLRLDEIFSKIKDSYLRSVSVNFRGVDCRLGFDYYWDFEPYSGRVITLGEVLQRADLTDADTDCEELNYLIKLNVEA